MTTRDSSPASLPATCVATTAGRRLTYAILHLSKQMKQLVHLSACPSVINRLFNIPGNRYWILSKAGWCYRVTGHIINLEVGAVLRSSRILLAANEGCQAMETYAATLINMKTLSNQNFRGKYSGDICRQGQRAWKPLFLHSTYFEIRQSCLKPPALPRIRSISRQTAHAGSRRHLL